MLLSGAYNSFYSAGEDSLSQQSFTYLKSTVETLEKEKMFKVTNKDTRPS